MGIVNSVPDLQFKSVNYAIAGINRLVSIKLPIFVDDVINERDFDKVSDVVAIFVLLVVVVDIRLGKLDVFYGVGDLRAVFKTNDLVADFQI